jgi:hypothetical protein
MVSNPTHAEELFQMRLLLEQQLLSADLDDERAVAGLLQQVDWLQGCCGERQLTHAVSSWFAFVILLILLYSMFSNACKRRSAAYATAIGWRLVWFVAVRSMLR